MPGEHTLILGGPPATIKAVLERDKKPVFTEGLQKALKDADLSQAVSVAVDVKGIGSEPMIGGLAKGINIDVSSVESAVINIAISSDVKVNAIAMCKDAKTAESYRKMADGGVEAVKNNMAGQVPKEVMEILEGLKIKDKDNQLTASVTMKGAPLLSLAKEVLGQEAKVQFKAEGKPVSTREFPK